MHDYDLGDTLTVTSRNANTGTPTRHDLTILQASEDGFGGVTVIGLDSIDKRLYFVTVDAETEALRSITCAESLTEALTLFNEQVGQTV